MVLITGTGLWAVRFGCRALFGSLLALLRVVGHLTATLTTLFATTAFRLRCAARAGLGLLGVLRHRSAALDYGLHLALAEHIQDVELHVLLDELPELGIVLGLVGVAVDAADIYMHSIVVNHQFGLDLAGHGELGRGLAARLGYLGELLALLL